VAAGDRRRARHHQLEHLVANAALIAVVGHGVGEPPDDAELSLRLAEQEQAGVGRLVAAGEIDCELLAADGWQVEGKQRIVGHGGCGARLVREAHRQDNDLLRESRTLHHSRQTPSHD
jgi:hypothetical protein